MKKEDQNKPKKEDEAEEWDFSEGFGGIPDDVDLTRNIGCASDSKKGKNKKNLSQDMKSENKD
ncbi:hypothetical protein Belba_1227 [Belliella baltica DSM 15883]|uniref:Uncharacterized protein n=1 Tax=Belliella baltica (strain DSM 15883 / CIP 108006 / LMG 21964 / BA134) TaxID=866536 RepID=I3Z3P3_BELBD|nr:hypothetical protein [Belliella baltica]AFL83861.1 hypothetical protein Belba_1227 [Belliella baltica DSM 15883]